jgi:hypothetical protein
MNRIFCCALALCIGCTFGMVPVAFGQQSAATVAAGGQGGSPFRDGDVAAGARVSEIHVFSGKAVDSVQMLYALPDGRTLTGARHGGPGGRQNIFRLDPDEYIVGLSGRHGEYIDSLQIQTNKRTTPVYGGSGGSRNYRVDVPSGNYGIGFVGRSGDYVDAIGLTYLPLRLQIAGQTEIAGGRGGSSFSDRDIPLGARISEIRIRSGQSIDSIQAVYLLQDGRTFEGPVHGGRGGNLSVFRLEPGEYITGFSGRYGDYLDSLIIRTNQRTSQTFGGRGGSRNFAINVPAGNQVSSLTGRSGEYLDAIGLLYSPVDTLSQPRRPRFRADR